MAKASLERTIFRNGSRTYYWSSKFFPKEIRGDVFKLYSFVRLVDDYVDSAPQQKAAFQRLRRSWDKAQADPAFDPTSSPDESPDQRVIKNMIAVSKKYNFDPSWVEAFLDAMHSDLHHKPARTIDDTLRYMYGSAEVIGLMMARIMRLTPEAYEAAMLQGRAMQFINFIRDIAEDQALGRCYLPREDYERFGLSDLRAETAHAHLAAFKKFIHFELSRYRKWQQAAEEGYRYIPRRLRVPLTIAVEAYNWTGEEVAKRPWLIYDHKVRPTRSRLVAHAAKALVR